MQVNANPNVGATAKIAGLRPSSPSARVERDKAAFLETDALNEALQQVPDVRPEAVDRARALVRDSQYPPLDVLRNVADLLTTRL